MEFTELLRCTKSDDEKGVTTESIFLNYEVIISLILAMKLLSSVSVAGISIFLLVFITMIIFTYGIKSLVRDSLVQLVEAEVESETEEVEVEAEAEE